MVERLVDLVAAKLKMDPAEIRKKNFIPPFTDGHTVATGLVYDSGNYIARLRQGARRCSTTRASASKQADAAREGRVPRHRPLHLRRDLRPRALAGRGRGRLRRRPLGERDRALPPLRARSTSWSASRRTARARRRPSPRSSRASSAWRVDDVEVLHGDTERTPMGWGSYGSRSTPVGSGALMGAIGKIQEKAKIVTAHLLEAAVEDIDYADGKFFVKGSPAQVQDDPGRGPDGQRRLELPQGPRARPRSLGLLRSRRTSSTPSAPTSPSSGSTSRPARSSSSATSRSTTAAASSTR